MTEREQLEMELLAMQIADLTAALEAIEDFNDLIAPHVPTVIRIGAESDHTLMRLGSQMKMFAEEITRTKANLISRQTNAEAPAPTPAP